MGVYGYESMCVCMSMGYASMRYGILGAWSMQVCVGISRYSYMCE